MSTAVYINNSEDDRSNGNVMDGDENNGEEEVGEEQLRGATANPAAPVDLGILSLDDEDLTLVEDGTGDDEDGSGKTNWLLDAGDTDGDWKGFLVDCDVDRDAAAISPLSPLSRVKKRSLVNKLDALQSRGSPTRSFMTPNSTFSANSTAGAGNGIASPLFLNRMTRIASTSTPSKGSVDADRFRTFTRRDRQVYAAAVNNGGLPGLVDLDNDGSGGSDEHSPIGAAGGGVGGRLNTTFGIVEDEAEAAAAGAPNTTYTRLLDATFDQKMRLDTTFDLDHQQQQQHPPVRGQQYQQQQLPQLNSTFSAGPPPARKASDDLSRGSSSHDTMDDDRLSTTSDCSISHHLHDLGDVQHVARIQEAALNAPVQPSQQQQPTLPSSSSSVPQHRHDKQLLSPDSNPPTHYSSQDSLPDSPYSSQSLESQPDPSDQRRHTRGSMPNLNKRGRGGRAGGGGQVGQGLAAPGGRKASASATRAPTAGSGYGLSRQHTSSDPRLLQHHTTSDPRLLQQQQQRQGRGSQLQMQPPPQRGYSMPRGGDRRTPEYQAGYAQQPQQPRYAGPSAAATATARPAAGSGLRPPSAGLGSRLARPAGTGIPRPGSRLPTFSNRGGGATAAIPMRGIPKPSGIAAPSGSRSNSATRQQNRNSEWMDDCY